MLIYYIVESYPYEGYGLPIKGFIDKQLAIEEKIKLKDLNRYGDFDIEELEIDMTEFKDE